MKTILKICVMITTLLMAFKLTGVNFSDVSWWYVFLPILLICGVAALFAIALILLFIFFKDYINAKYNPDRR